MKAYELTYMKKRQKFRIPLLLFSVIPIINMLKTAYDLFTYEVSK